MRFFSFDPKKEKMVTNFSHFNNRKSALRSKEEPYLAAFGRKYDRSSKLQDNLELLLTIKLCSLTKIQSACGSQNWQAKEYIQH
jgi:hypothetical protein